MEKQAINEEEWLFEKEFSRIDELRKKIEEYSYVEYAISKMANEICQRLMISR